MANPPLLTGTIRALYMSESKACAIDGLDLKCWGNNGDESLATGPGLISTPVTVATNVETAILAEWGVCYASTGPLECRVAPGLPDAVALQGQIQTAAVESILDLTVDPWLPLLCATTSNGKLYCGGDNSRGVLDPLLGGAPISGFNLLNSDALKFAFSIGHICGDLGGSLSCAGTDSYGQLGNGDTDFNTQAGFVPVVSSP
jgi:hypothetical protein